VFTGENKITGRGSQGACRQDVLTGGKPPVVKYDVTLNESLVGYSPGGKDVSRGHCKDPLPGND
jgi:hypothetical protein